jgi:hypothetical protein
MIKQTFEGYFWAPMTLHTLRKREENIVKDYENNCVKKYKYLTPKTAINKLKAL